VALAEKDKKGELESIRGLASCAVVIGHFFGSFAEPRDLPAGPAHVYSMLANGTPAVVIFFVLSGIVLPLSFFRSGGDKNVIAVAALNRFPRLMLLVFLTVMGSYLIAASGLNFSKAAAEISGSSWFASFGYPNPNASFQPDLLTALRQGVYGTLLENSSEFNVSLWTMHHELYGSFISFALAVFFFKAPMRLVYLIATLAVVALQFTAWRLTPFVAGTALSAFLFRNPDFALKPYISWASIVMGLVLYRYHFGNAAYWPTAFIPWGSDDHKGWIIYTISGVLLIIGIVGNKQVRSAMNAKWLIALGRHSFAIYAAHMMVMASIVSFVFINVAPLGKTIGLMITTLVFIVVMGIVARVLTEADEWWMRWSRGVVKRIVSPSVATLHRTPKSIVSAK